jgi:hypothetical protein
LRAEYQIGGVLDLHQAPVVGRRKDVEHRTALPGPRVRPLAGPRTGAAIEDLMQDGGRELIGQGLRLLPVVDAYKGVVGKREADPGGGELAGQPALSVAIGKGNRGRSDRCSVPTPRRLEPPSVEGPLPPPGPRPQARHGLVGGFDAHITGSRLRQAISVFCSPGDRPVPQCNFSDRKIVAWSPEVYPQAGGAKFVGNRPSCSMVSRPVRTVAAGHAEAAAIRMLDKPRRRSRPLSRKH